MVRWPPFDSALDEEEGGTASFLGCHGSGWRTGVEVSFFVCLCILSEALIFLASLLICYLPGASSSFVRSSVYHLRQLL